MIYVRCDRCEAEAALDLSAPRLGGFYVDGERVYGLITDGLRPPEGWRLTAQGALCPEHGVREE